MLRQLCQNNSAAATASFTCSEHPGVTQKGHVGAQRVEGRWA